MTPESSLRKYALLGALGFGVLWALICYAAIVSPRLHGLDEVSKQLERAQKDLFEMKREIENAQLSGGPSPGGGRFDKFGILTTGEEHLFLADLIDYCKETNNTLNGVIRAQQLRPAQETPTIASPGAGVPGQIGGPVTGPPTPGQPQPQGQPGQPPPLVIYRLPVTINLLGTFRSSFDLLRRLEVYKRLLTVEKLDITTDAQKGYPNMNTSISIDLYLVKEPRIAVPAPVSGAAAAPPAPAAG